MIAHIRRARQHQPVRPRADRLRGGGRRVNADALKPRRVLDEERLAAPRRVLPQIGANHDRKGFRGLDRRRADFAVNHPRHIVVDRKHAGNARQAVAHLIKHVVIAVKIERLPAGETNAKIAAQPARRGVRLRRKLNHAGDAVAGKKGDVHRFRRKIRRFSDKERRDGRAPRFQHVMAAPRAHRPDRRAVLQPSGEAARQFARRVGVSPCECFQRGRAAEMPHRAASRAVNQHVGQRVPRYAQRERTGVNAMQRGEQFPHRRDGGGLYSAQIAQPRERDADRARPVIFPRLRRNLEAFRLEKKAAGARQRLVHENAFAALAAERFVLQPPLADIRRRRDALVR